MTTLDPGPALLAPHGPPGSRRDLAWETELDRLELDVLMCARLLNTPGDDLEVALPRLHAWEPSAGLGSLPDHLAGRAREIAARQDEVRGLIAAAMDKAREQRETTRRPVTSAFEPLSTPAYLDLRA